MQRTTVVESDRAMTRRTLKDAGFDDEQARALIDLSGTAAERREIKTAVDELKQNVAILGTEMQGGFARLDARVDGLRDEMNARFKGQTDELNARFKGLEGRLDERFKGLEGRMDARFEGLGARLDGVEGQIKLMIWIMGVGVTVYAGMTASLLVLLFRTIPA